MFGCLGFLAVCSVIRSGWPWVRLLGVFGRVFGCYKFLAVCSAVSDLWLCGRLCLALGSAVRSVWPCVPLLQVFGRVFGCFKCWAVCAAVTIFGPCVQLLQALAMRSAVPSIGRFRFCYFLHVFICTLFYLFWALPIHFISRAFFFSRSFYSSISYFCSALFMYSLFLHILCVLILLCFGRDFCFLLFRSYSRELFFPRRTFILFCYSCGFSFLFYAMQFSSTSP